MPQKHISFLKQAKIIFVFIIAFLWASPHGYATQDDYQTLVTQSSSSCNSTTSYIDDPYQFDVRSQTCETVRNWMKIKINDCCTVCTPLVNESDWNIEDLHHLEDPISLYDHCSYYICGNITWQFVTAYNHTWEEFWAQEMNPFIHSIHVLYKQFKIKNDKSPIPEKFGKSNTINSSPTQDCRVCLLELMVTLLTNFESRFYKELIEVNDLP